MKIRESWEVVVRINGVPLEEFQTIASEEGRRLECHIPSEAGKPFDVLLRQIAPVPRGQVQRIILTVDGQWARQILSDGPRTPNLLTTWNGKRSGDYVLPFHFSQLVTSDEASSTPTGATGLGSIEVKIETGTHGRPRPAHLSHPPAAPPPSASIAVYHELAVKKSQLTHHTGFGEPTHTNTMFTNVTFARSTAPDHFFTFHYKSRDLLQAMGIIPAPTAAPPQSANAVAGPSRARASLPTDVIELGSSDDEAEKKDVKPNFKRPKSEPTAEGSSIPKKKKKLEPPIKEVKPKIEGGVIELD